MPRYDKYEPFAGGFRAALAANFGYTAGVPDKAHADLGKMFAVGLDATGRVVKGGGVSGVLGVMVLTKPRAAGEIVDVMTDGEIVEFALEDGGDADPGTRYYADATTGGYNATPPVAPANYTLLGFTVEATRLVVRVDRAQA